MHNNIATLYAAFKSPGNKVFEKRLTTSGDTNCPMYRLAEISGIMEVTACFPPFIDAIVLMYGTPMPLAIPPNIKAITVVNNVGDKVKNQ